MKRIATEFQNRLYDTRMLIELNFRNLKVLHGLETSMPRSVDGYLGNYVYSLLAYVLCQRNCLNERSAFAQKHSQLWLFDVEKLLTGCGVL